MVETMQEDIQEVLQSMSREEQLTYWHTQAEKLRERKRRLRSQPLQNREPDAIEPK
jgi:hypothetical protein